MAEKSTALTPVDLLKQHLNSDSVQIQFKNALRDNAGPFIASIIDLYGSDTNLQACSANAVIMEALKAATLKLPINKQLGFAWIVPYKDKGGKPVPQFQLGYKGYIQLAMRTGQYKYLNAGIVFEGCTVKTNVLTGETTIKGEPKNEKPLGYFAHMELLNGFTKTVYMTKEKVTAHAKKYSKSYGNKGSAWTTDFDAMATKTVVRRLLSKYGILSVEMQTALLSDVEDEVEAQHGEYANSGTVIDAEFEEVKEPPAELPAETPQEPVQEELAGTGTDGKGPGF